MLVPYLEGFEHIQSKKKNLGQHAILKINPTATHTIREEAQERYPDKVNHHLPPASHLIAEQILEEDKSKRLKNRLL